MILGASYDTPEENRAFREKYAYPFPLLCDTERKLGIAYGAGDAQSSHPDRITIVVGPDGLVQRVYDKVNPFEHADQVLRDLGGTPPKKGKGFLRKLFGK